MSGDPSARDLVGERLAAAVVTCSDSAATGRADDTSGPLAVELLRGLGHPVAAPVVVPDEVAAIGAAVREAIAAGARIVVTTGGTGGGPRDVTPEALRDLGLRELPGFGEAIRAASRDRIPAADLSRALGGVLGESVVLALPGSPGGVRDGLAAVGGLLEHAALMAQGGGHATHRHATHRHAPVRPRAAHPDPAHPDPAHADPAHADPAYPDPISLASGASSHHDPANSGMSGERPGPSPNSLAFGASSRHDPAISGVSGVSATPIDEAEVAAEVGSPHAGAVVTFVGVVRDHDHDRAVTALHYEGHPDAAHVLADVLAEARQRPGVLHAAARHRVGELAVGDVAFVAAVSAAHRGEAFAGCAWLVDEAKARLPIWKHQFFADGTDEWVNCP